MGCEITRVYCAWATRLKSSSTLQILSACAFASLSDAKVPSTPVTA